MASPAPDSPQPLAEIVAYLFTRREAILNHWRTACEQDPTLSKVAAMSREEFNNLLPVILDILEQRLLGQLPEADPGLAAMAHGLHRWQKAHDLIETMQELHHLAQILYSELQTFQELMPQTEAGLLLKVYQQIAQIMSETMQGSLKKYDDLQRLEAANRADTLQQALHQMNELSRQRGDLLRTSSHDLRGSFGVISGATALLKMDGLNEEERHVFVDMLSRSLTQVHTLLNSLMDLSRLEAGTEDFQPQDVDASLLIHQLVASAQPIASERGLVLQADGPDSLPVQTDPVILQRIVQNLLLNALKYTPTGFISVSWSSEGDMRWILSVQDSGPGLPPDLIGLLAQQLKPTVEPTSVLGPEQSEPMPALPTAEQEIPASLELEQFAAQPTKGEGVGLQIVKRLSQLLGASLEIETKADRGTLFRLRMPIRHDS